jgi:adenosylhomocysteine nucleosidase
MSVTLAIIAALPREIAALVHGTPPDRALLRDGVHLYRLNNAIVVAAGMGSARATIAVQAAVKNASVRTLISVGLAGGCSPELSAGDVAEASLVVDARTGERFSVGVAKTCVLVTSDAIASVHEKARLAASYGAALVDMEAASVARLALANGVEFRAIKAVSDAHDFELASLSRFAGKHGSFRTGAFALHTAVRPHHWKKAAQLGRDSNRGLAGLHARLTQVIAEEKTVN